VKARPHFLRSAEHFERIWDSGGRTPAVACNLAQAYFLAGDIGRAIGAFRRGLRIDPHDRDLRRGLDFVRGQVSYPLTGDVAAAARPRDVATATDHIGLSLPRLALGVLVAAAGGWYLLARAWLGGRRRGLAFVASSIIVMAYVLAAGLWWEDRRVRAEWARPFAVVSDWTEFLTGNSDEYPRRIDGRLPAGVEVRILGERGGWLHVELADGTAGWLPSSRAVTVD
jgi:hypothetical protein